MIEPLEEPLGISNTDIKEVRQKIVDLIYEGYLNEIDHFYLAILVKERIGIDIEPQMVLAIANAFELDLIINQQLKEKR